MSKSNLSGININIFLLINVFILGLANGKDAFFDSPPFLLFYTGAVVLGDYLFWGEPYKVEKKENTFVFFSFREKIISTDES